jgi:CYTH domain-containing protein
MIEIERKFLVKNSSFLQQAHKHSKMIQGYLSRDPKRTVRVRLVDEKGILTIKGQSSSSGMSRFEWEKEIDYKEAKDLLALALENIIEKVRYFIKWNNVIFEVDVFEGVHLGLILAEVELKKEDEKVHLPKWVGEEVTGQKEYYNSYLSFNTLKKS